MFERDVEKETCNECPIYFSHRLCDFQDNATKGNLLDRIMLYLCFLTLQIMIVLYSHLLQLSPDEDTSNTNRFPLNSTEVQ
jgi:hypothetical protein